MIKKISRWFLITVGALLMVGIAAVGGVWFWLSSGERELGKYWAAIAPMVLPYHIARDTQLDSLTVTFNQPAERIEIHAKNVRWGDRSGAFKAVIQDVSATLGLHDTLKGQGKLTALSLVNPSLELKPELYQPSKSKERVKIPDTLQQIAIVNGRIQLQQANGVRHSLERIEGTAVQSEGAIAVALRASAPGNRGEGQLFLQAIYQVALGNYRVTLDIANLEIATLAMSQTLLPLKHVHIPASGLITLSGNMERLEEMEFDLTAGEGRIRVPPVFPDPLYLTSMELKGYLTHGLDSLVIERFHSDWGGAELSGNVDASNLLDQPSIIINARLQNFYMDDLQYFWPHTLAPEPRKWVTQNIPYGFVPEATLSINMPQEAASQPKLADETVSAVVNFRGLTVQYLPDIPPILEGKGVARFNAHTMDIAVESAKSMNSIHLSDGRVVIPDMPAHHPEIAISFKAEGALADVARYINRPMFSFHDKLAFKPDGVGGSAIADVKLHLPLMSRYPHASIPEFLDFDISGRAIEPRIPSILSLPYAISGGNLGIAISNEGVKLDGAAILAGAPLDLNAHVDMKNPANPATRYTVRTSGPLDNLRGFGVPELDFIRGTVGVTAQQEPGAPLKVEANMAQAAIDLERLGVNKPMGQAAVLRFAIPDTKNGPAQIQDVAFDSAAVSFAGQVALTENKELARLELMNLRSGRNQLNAVLVPRPSGDGMEVDIKAAVVDASPFLRQWKKATDPQPNDSTLDITLAADTVWGLSSTPLQGVKTHILCEKGGGCLPVQLQGTLDQIPVQVSAQEAGQGARRLVAQTNNAGALLRFLDMYANIGKGKLNLQTVIYHHGTKRELSRGEAVLTDFTVTNAPVMAKLLSVASVTGLQDGINDRDISFTSLEIPFESSGGIIRIKEGRCSGPSLGFRFDGSLDQRRSYLDLKGTVIPLYALNTLVGNTPLIGKVLSGGEDKGVFAMNFTVKGPLNNPDVDTNPLSMVTPGFIREMFSRKRTP